MKQNILFLLLLVSFSVFSQNKVSLKLKNEAVNIAMNAVSKQTAMEFVYNPQIINTNRIVSVDMANENIDKAMALLLDDLYTYKIKGKYIVIISEKNITDKHSVKELFKKELERKVENNLNSSSGTSIASGLSISRSKKPVSEKLELAMTPQITNNIKDDATMLKKAASLIALSALTVMPIDAQTNKKEVVEKVKTVKVKEEFNTGLEKSLVQLSFLYPLSTDGTRTKDKEYKFSLNMLGGITGGVSGAELGGLFNINKQDMRGLQMGGIFNITGGQSVGLQMGGIFNSAKISRGAQFGGIFNHAQESSMVQVAGVSNFTKGNSTAQFAGVANFAKGNSTVQMAGVTNIAYNVGAQFAVVNIAKKSGFQMGIVNVSETDDGAMLGLFNYVKKGGLLEVGISGNDYITGAVNLITGTDRLYSILSMGVYKDHLSTGFGVGTRLQIKESASGVQLELMHNQLYKNNFKNKGLDASLEQFRAFYSHRKGKFNFYGGPTFNVLIQDVGFDTRKPIYSMFKDRGNTHHVDGWIGAEIGVRFNLK